MIVRTFLAFAFISISLISFGCTQQSAPAARQSAVSAPAQGTSENTQFITPVMEQQAGNPTPRPSVVRWVGPPPDSSDPDIAQSNSDSSPQAAGQPAVFATNNNPQRVSTEFENTPAPKPEALPVKIATVSPTLPPAHASVALANPSTMPTNTSSPVAMANVASAIKEAQQSWNQAIKITSAAANRFAKSSALHPSPATEPAPPVLVAMPPQHAAENTKLFSQQPTKAVSLQSILEKIPQQFRPSASAGWDSLSAWKAHKWIKDQLAGAELQVTVQIASVKLVRIPDANNVDETLRWELALTTQPESFRSFNIDTFHWPTTWSEDVFGKRWRGGDVRVPVTEDFANKARFWQAGDTVVLSGTVQDIIVEPGTTNLTQPCGKFTTIFSDIHIDKLIPQPTHP